MIRKRDVLKPWLVFRSAVTGRYVGRLFALQYPESTISERRWGKKS
jgi:hypothetical protein